MKLKSYLPQPEPKDVKRVETMIEKSRSYGIVNEAALLRQCKLMADKITNKDKAYRRASALLSVTGVTKDKLERSAQIFIDRAELL